MVKKRVKKQLKKDALNLAYVIYDIFKDGQKNDKISIGQNNAQNNSNN